MVAGTNRKSVYDIISVDWDPGQTRIWKYYVSKNCPTANIYLIKDAKPYPWNWASGKLNVFDYPFEHPDRIIYLDTDTIVTTDLEPVFELMGKADVGASGSITPAHLRLKKDKYMLNALGLDDVPVHYNSGFTIWKNIDPQEIGHTWKSLYEFPGMRPYRKFRTFNEHCLSYMIAYAGYSVWDQPADIHGNVLGPSPLESGKKMSDFDPKIGAMVIHYHKPKRLEQWGLGHLLRI